jgi:hypothetical protein
VAAKEHEIKGLRFIVLPAHHTELAARCQIKSTLPERTDQATVLTTQTIVQITTCAAGGPPVVLTLLLVLLKAHQTRATASKTATPPSQPIESSGAYTPPQNSLPASLQKNCRSATKLRISFAN